MTSYRNAPSAFGHNADTGSAFGTLDWFFSASITLPATTSSLSNTDSQMLPASPVSFDEIDLGNFSPSEGFSVQGASAGDQSGDSVSILGDINGDGFADFVIGARTAGANSSGEAYVIFGSAASANLDLGTLNLSDGFTISGADIGDRLGFSVSGAGDVNGDGLADIIVGARNGDEGGSNSGEAYLIFGGTSLTDIDVDNLSASQGVLIEGRGPGDRAGQAVSSAGDINGDGIDDLIIGSPFGGSATVVFGRTDLSSIDLGNLSELQGFKIDGPGRFGEAVAPVGDVNGDGIDDLIIGSSRGSSEGSAYIVFGGADLSDFDVRDMDPGRSIEIIGEGAGDQLGISVAGAGDVNGDGIDDFLVGARLNDTGGSNSGAAYVVFGGTSLANITLSALTPSQGFSISGADIGDQAGRAVSSAGDINGDGFDDLIIGATGGDSGGNNSGEAFVVFGGASLANIDLATLSASQGFVISGDANNDRLGQAVSGAGDINGDGFDDLLVGAYGNDAGGSNAGASYIIFGGATGTESTASIFANGTGAANNFSGNAGNDTFNGISTDDIVRAGSGSDRISITSTDFALIDGGLGGDTLNFVDGGLTLDLTNASSGRLSSIEFLDIRGSGANSLTLNASAVFDLTEFRAGGQTNIGIRANADDTITLSDDFVANGQFTAGNLTFDIFSAGNATINIETGATVVFVPAPDVPPAAAFVLEFDDVDSTTGIFIQGDSNGDRAGFAVSGIGDINGDGLDDVLIGAPESDDGGTNAGEAYVVFGGVSLADVDLANLALGQGFTIQGDFTGDGLGFSVSEAGDVNGDGLADFIIGARNGDNGGSDAGEAYVIFGGTSLNDIDLSNLAAGEGVVFEGADAGDQAGFAVSSAGDVNGDGFDDLFISAPSAEEAYIVFGGAALADTDLGSLGANGFTLSGINQLGRSISNLGDVNGDGVADLLVGAPITGPAGRAYVVFLNATMQGDVELGALSAMPGFVIDGVGGGDQFGISVSGLGDVNGDGLNDFVVGARLNDEGGNNAGASYVIYGAPGLSSIDLGTLAASQGIRITGDEAFDQLGRAVSDAGDVNGDGFADIILGAPGANNAGRAFVVFGGQSLDDIDLSLLEASQGFIIQGDGNNDRTGFAVASAGDVNGDGFDDLIIGAYQSDNGGTNAGEAVIIFGGATGTESLISISLAGTGGADNFTGNAGADSITDISTSDVVRGGAGADRFSVSTLDFASIDGGTGTDSLVLSGSGQTLDLTSTLGLRSIEVIDLIGTGDNTLILDQLAVFNLSEERVDGNAVLTVRRDLGDTVDLISAGFTMTGTIGLDGAVFDVFTNGNAIVRLQQVGGMAEPPAMVLDLTTLGASDGFVIRGDDAGDYAGYSVSSAGDINGDGFDDLIIGAPRGDDGGSDAGEAYIIFGTAGGFGADTGGRQVIDLTGLSASEGFIVQGDTDSDGAGFSVSSAGDVNGDGFDDLIIGAPYGYDGGSSAGEAYVLFGGSGSFGEDVSGRQVLDLASLTASEGFIIQGDGDGDMAGYSVSSAGDVNGDGFEDLIIGAPIGGNNGSFGSGAGEAFVVFGSGSGFGSDVGGRQVIDLTTLNASEGFVVEGDATNDYAGVSVSSAGDVNGDGFDDLIIGATGGDAGGANAGETYVIFGGTGTFGIDIGGRQVLELAGLSAAEGVLIEGDTVGGQSGVSVSGAGDVNGDGVDDLIIGSRDGGEAFVVFGSLFGFGASLDLATLSAAQGFVIRGSSFDAAGLSVSSAGDINGDGFGDLIIGAPYGDDGGTDAGDAYVIYGGSGVFGTEVSGRQVIDLATLTTSQGSIIQGETAGDLAGQSVASAGDVNGDGFDDLIVGAPGGDDGGTDAGEAYIIFGGNTGTESLIAEVGTIAPIDFTSDERDDDFVTLGSETANPEVELKPLLNEDTTANPDLVLQPLSSDALRVSSLQDLSQEDLVAEAAPFALEFGKGSIINTPTDEEHAPIVLVDFAALNVLIDG